MYTYFFKGNRMKIVLGISGTCWSPWWTSKMRSRLKTSRSWPIFSFVMWCIIYTYFFKGNPMKIVLGTSGTCWSSWVTSTIRSRSRTSRSLSIFFFLHVIHIYLFLKGKSVHVNHGGHHSLEVPKSILFLISLQKIGINDVLISLKKISIYDVSHDKRKYWSTSWCPRSRAHCWRPTWWPTSPGGS